MQTKTKPNGDIIMKNFTKVVLATAISVASIGASAASYDAAFDLRDRLEGVYSSFGEGNSFVGSANTVNSYGELLYVIDNQRDGFDQGEIMALGLDDVGHIVVNNPTIQQIDELNVNDINESVDRFVSNVNNDLFGEPLTAEASQYKYYDSEILATDNGGIIGSELNKTVKLVADYNVARIANADGTNDPTGAKTAFEANFLGVDGADGFQTKFNNAVDVLADVNAGLNSGSTAEGAYASYAIGADITTTFNLDGSVTINSRLDGVGSDSGNFHAEYHTGTGDNAELDAGSAAYRAFLTAEQNGTLIFTPQTVDASDTVDTSVVGPAVPTGT